MFFQVESGDLINLTLVSRIEFNHVKKLVRCWNAGVFECESEALYTFLQDPKNRAPLMLLDASKT